MAAYAGAATGVNTRAYREQRGSAATGAQTRAARYGYSPQLAAAPFTPPPIPSSYYNPIRDIESSEGKRGSEQAINGLERQKTDLENQFGINSSEIGQREGVESSAHQEALDKISEAFKRLGVRQAEGANSTGTLFGGALLASAQKRAANEGLQTTAENNNFGLQQQADATDRGKLGVALGEGIGPNGSLTEQLLNARTNQQGFENSLGSLEIDEAGKNGYKAPGVPSSYHGVAVGSETRAAREWRERLAAASKRKR